ncbi:NADP-dependent oxidoreductase [bacterium]|nr:NADP-dependent oxidoreductase [bacterium]
MTLKNIQILLAQRPIGEPKLSDFKIVETDLTDLVQGQILVRNHFLSLDPYMRGRMNNIKSYSAPMKLGEVMVGMTVGVVITSQHPDFQPNDMVTGNFGWQLYGISDGTNVQKIIEKDLPASLYLGTLGMPGVTGYVGLLDICQPNAGETVVVTAASGAVGGVVGQIAKLKGCRVVGIAGGPEKCRYVMDELGMDACVDYKANNLLSDLKTACPEGIDVCFENVGGPIFDTILLEINPFARIALCGLISQYNATQLYGIKNMGKIVVNRARMQGFVVSDHINRWPQAINDLSQWLREDRIKYRESVVDGLENAPEAFIDLLKGKNFGKQLIRLI